jgi:hypothetical protein
MKMQNENNEVLENNKTHSTPSARMYQLRISFEFDKGFITIWPAISINLHSKTIEINWIVFGMYIDF